MEAQHTTNDRSDWSRSQIPLFATPPNLWFIYKRVHHGDMFAVTRSSAPKIICRIMQLFCQIVESHVANCDAWVFIFVCNYSFMHPAFVMCPSQWPVLYCSWFTLRRTRKLEFAMIKLPAPYILQTRWRSRGMFHNPASFSLYRKYEKIVSSRQGWTYFDSSAKDE